MPCLRRYCQFVSILLVALAVPTHADIPVNTPPALLSLAATAGYTNGLPEDVQPSSDGRTVFFLRSGPTDTVKSLYETDTATETTRKLLDPSDLNSPGSTLTTFQVSDDGAEILLPHLGRIYLFRVAVRQLLAFAGGEYNDPLLSPDGKSIAAVKRHDIVVIDVATGRVKTLTSGGSDTISRGLSDHVALRDFGREQGLWWSPDSHYLAYEQYDSAPVTADHIVDLDNPERVPVIDRFPYAGTAIAEVRLGIAPLAGGPTVWANIDGRNFPYIARVVWRFETAPLSVVLLARDQREEALYAVSPKTGEARLLIKQTQQSWVSSSPDPAHCACATAPYWLSDGSGFLWLSCAAGDWQIELRARSGTLVRALTPIGLHVRSLDDVNEKTGMIAFEADQDPRQCQLFQTDFRGGTSIPLTHTIGVHQAFFSRDHSMYVDTFSLADNEAGADVFSMPTGFRLERLPSVAQTPITAPNVKFVRSTNFPAFDAAVILPQRFDHLRHYPAILIEKDSLEGVSVTAAVRSYEDAQWYADQGYIVIYIDSRGSADRGWNSEEAVKYSVATVPIHDQTAALEALAADIPQIDLTRVAIVGTGIGGYVASLGTMLHPDTFACGVAINPVVDWGAIDSALAERYLDTPKIDPVGYHEADLCTYAGRLQRPLLIMQDLSTSSVGVAETLKLTDTLYTSGTPFDFTPIDAGSRSLDSPVYQIALHTRIIEYLADELLP